MKSAAGLVFAVLVLASCTAAGVPAVSVAGTPGFWLGLWHGFILPVTFVVSLFNHDVGVYAAINEGAWYNFGFFLGVAVSMGGGSRVGSRRRSKQGDSQI